MNPSWTLQVQLKREYKLIQMLDNLYKHELDMS